LIVFEIAREKDGTLVLKMPEMQAKVMRQLVEWLRELLARPDFTNSVIQRLFPAAYRDGKQEAEYRALLGDDLRRRKLECIDHYEKTFRESRRRRGRVEVRIAAEAFEFWLGFVNDMRLTLGTALGIKDEAMAAELDLEGDQGHQAALFHYLGFLEEELLKARGFPDSQALYEEK
jgi:hypothetical protein